MLLEIFVMGYSVMANPTATAFLEVLNDRKKNSCMFTVDMKCCELNDSSKTRSKRLLFLFDPKCKSADSDKRIRYTRFGRLHRKMMGSN